MNLCDFWRLCRSLVFALGEPLFGAVRSALGQHDEKLIPTKSLKQQMCINNQRAMTRDPARNV